MPTTFASLGLPEQIARALAEKNITAPFPIQEKAIPDILAGRDVAGRAPTGSGKTLAFGLPLLATVGRGSKRRPRSLVLAPTRELAEQIKDELAPLGNITKRYVTAIYGGVPYGRQRTELNRGVDVLVATPGRLEDLIEQGMVQLDGVDFVVVDEADRMADMGFLPAVRRILDRTDDDRQTLLFSATLDGDVAVLIRDYQRDPVRHEAGAVETEADEASHHFWEVDHHDRVRWTADIIGDSGRSIVFTRTRHGADRLAKQLGRTGVKAVALHGGRSQNQRQRALKSFSNGGVSALIATDVAARGIHVDNVDTVVHFDPAADHKDYVHRSGRTARAGESGTVISLVTAEKRKSVQGMQRQLGMSHGLEKPMLPVGGANGRTMTDRDDSDRSDRAQPRGRTATVGDRSNIFVGNLPWTMTDNDLERAFSDHGTVLSADVISDRRTGRSKGFGFVEMSRSEAMAAIGALHGASIGGRQLKVREADRDREPRRRPEATPRRSGRTRS